MTYHDMAEELARYGNELLDDLDMGALPASTRRDSKLRSAAALIVRAAELVLELDTTPECAAEVRALTDLCACLRDRGDHMADFPHGSEDGECPAFRSVRPLASPRSRCPRGSWYRLQTPPHICCLAGGRHPQAYRAARRGLPA